MNENENAVAQEPVATQPAEIQAAQTGAPQTVPQTAASATATSTAATATTREAVAPEKPAPITPEPKKDEMADMRVAMERAMGMALDSSARAAAAELGVRPDRIQYAVKLADLSGIDLGKPGAREAIAAAVGKALEAVPELKGGAGTGSLGNHPRQPQTIVDQAASEFRRGLNG